MKALVVVHTEMPYLDPHKLLSVLDVSKELMPVYLEHAQLQTERLSGVFDGIASEIDARLSSADSVYYLGDLSTPSDTSPVYPAIRAYFPHMTFVPSTRGYSLQYLALKGLLMGRETADATVVGVVHACCVTDVYSLLAGREQRKSTIRDYATNAQRAKIPYAAVQCLITACISSRIQEELTDKCLE